MASISRRRFVTAVGAAGAGATAPAVAAPAIAQSSPELKWRMPVSWPKSLLDTLYGSAEQFTKYVSDATDGRFQIRVMVGDERIPALEVTDAVSNGTVEACHTAPYYMFNKDPTFAFGCAVPFGLNGRMQNSWWLEGGDVLMNAFYAKYNIYGLLAGNTMAQMGGWFRKEINTIDDLKGVKMRIGGFAGVVIGKLGVVPQQMPGSEIYQALEKGVVDAAEWVGPHDDEKLGLQKVAKFYYYPGWWEGGAMLHVQINKEQWESLPKHYQAALKAAAALTHNFTVARYDALNPIALKKIVAAGTQLRPFSEAIMDACFKAANEVYADIGGKNEDFKKLWDSTKAFRADQYLWQQLADNSYDNYMMIQQRKKTL